MSEHVSPHTLWVLVMGVVFFLFGYMFYCAIIPPQLQTGSQYAQLVQQLQGNAPNSQYSGNNFLIYNSTDNFVLNYFQETVFTLNIPETKLNDTNGQDIRIFYGSLGTFSTSFLFYLRHYDTTFFIFPTNHLLNLQGSSSNVASISFILSAPQYDNLTDTSTMTFSDSSYACNVWIQSATNVTLAQSLYNGLPLNVSVTKNLNLDLSGNGIFQVLGLIFTFQSVKTGIVLVDLGINALISIPLYVAIAYIMYRLIAGLIPTVSGGGGY